MVALCLLKPNSKGKNVQKVSGYKMEIIENETIVTYFAGTAEQDYDTFEEAKQAVLDNISSLDKSHDKLVKVKKVQVNQDGSYQMISGKLTHEEMVELSEGDYLCYSVYLNSNEPVLCSTNAEIENLVKANKEKLMLGDTQYVTKEIMTISDRALDPDFEMIDPSETFEGQPDPIVEGVPLLSSEFVNDGTTPNLASTFEYEKVRVYG